MSESALLLPDLIRRAATAHPNSEAVTDGLYRYTYAELLDRVRRMAKLLHSLGVRKGDRVALLMPPSASHLIALFGAIELGAIPSALHVRESEATLAAVIQRLSPRVMVYDGAFAGKAETLCSNNHLITATIRSLSTITPAMKQQPGPVIPRDLDNYADDFEPMPSAPDDPAVIALSSGTTGIPKGIIHTHRTLVASGRYGAPYMAAHRGATGINLFTTAFIGWYNCTLPFLYGGAKIVYVSQWEPQTFLQTIQDEKVSVCFLVPTMWRMLLREAPERYDLTALERIGYAGEIMDTDTMRQLRERICPSIINTYGTTETGSWGGCTVMTPTDYQRFPEKIESVGRPGDGVEVSVVVPGGSVEQPVKAGESGEVIFSGPSVARQLWEQPALSRKIFDGHWWRSGDMGTMDAQGYLYLQGRLDDMIISGGINVMPSEVEDAILSHPAVSECVVIGLPNEKWGQQITAFVVCNTAVTAQALEEHVNRGTLSGYKKPREYRFVTELPRGNTGKVNRKMLRDQVLAESSER